MFSMLGTEYEYAPVREAWRGSTDDPGMAGMTNGSEVEGEVTGGDVGAPFVAAAGADDVEPDGEGIGADTILTTVDADPRS